MHVKPKKISDEDILKIARQCLSEQGASVSTQFIADQLGISQATLFKRFGTKIKLLQAAINLPVQSNRFLKRLERAPTEEPLQKQLEELCLDMLAFFEEMLPYLSSIHSSGLCLSAPASENSPPVLARKKLAKWIEALQDVDRIRKDISSEAVSIALLGTVQHRAFRTHVLKDTCMLQNKEEYISSVINVIWAGLSPEDTNPSKETEK